MRLKYTLIFSLIISTSFSQVISWIPEFPNINDTITLTYNSSLGNANLSTVNDIYAHTGILNKFSSSYEDWKNIPVEWHEGPDTTIKLTNLGNNIHQIKFKIKDFYNIRTSDNNEYMCFVFRNSVGSLSGANASNLPFFIPIFNSNEIVKFIEPIEFPIIKKIGDILDIKIKSKQVGMINLFNNGQLIAQNYSDSLIHSLNISSLGKFDLTLEMQLNGNSYHDTISYVVESNQLIQDPPTGTKNGINYINDSTVIFQLEAPQKNFVYLIGDINNWEIDPIFRMRKSQTGDKFWIKIDNLSPNVEYLFQYFVDARIKIADPYSQKIISEYDQYIPNSVYPNLISYPKNKTTHAVSVVEINKANYTWKNNQFNPPDSRDLIIYELLIRDFSFRSDYQTVIDSLSYLKKLGINAIQLMPIIEFDGLSSWGYAPTFFFAAEKFYGPEDKLKELIDSCHSNDIAVIMDIVFNHAFRPNPWLRLYYDKGKDVPNSQSPWFNETPKHPFNVGYDFNHSSPYVQTFIDSVLDYWTKEYKFDGYRFDLSKGFTQFNSLGNVALWGNYDITRINNIKRISNNLWSKHPGTYVILEHFADNNEEKELSDHGCMLWGKAHSQYNEASMGYVGNGPDNFEWQISKNERGWNFHNLVGFMESHDEERLMYNNLNYGNSNSNYDTKDLNTALKRMGQAAAFFFTVPGPKMFWQFGEYGYDYSINFPSNTDFSRTSPKPVKWDYLQNFNRYNLFLEYSALINLKKNNPVFRTSNYRMETWGTQKQIYIDDPSMNVVIIGNFNTVDDYTYTGFQNIGWWYDYMSGDSLDVNDVNMSIFLEPGEWRVFTNKKIENPNLYNPNITTSIRDATKFVNVYPNPSKGDVNISYKTDKLTKLSIYDCLGKLIYSDQKNPINSRINFIWQSENQDNQSIKSGNYFYKLENLQETQHGNIIIVND